MEKAALQAQVREIMASLFGLAPGDVNSDTSLATVEAWDSLNHVNLMMALEQSFGVRIDTDDALEMTSFDEVCQRLERYVEGSS